MIQVLLILMFASLHAFDTFDVHARVSLGLWPTVGITLGGLAALWGGFHILCLACGRSLDHSGRLRMLRVAERAMLSTRLLAGAWWGGCLFQLGLLTSVRDAVGDFVFIDELLTMLPVLLMFVGMWWSFYPLELRLREALLWRELHDPAGGPIHPPMSRGQFVVSQVRHQMMLFLVPLSMMLAWQEAVVMHVEPRLMHAIPRWASIAVPVAHYAGILGVLVASPAIMRHVWDTREIKDSPLRTQVQGMCARYGVRVRGPLLWRTHGSLVNGAILGVFWPLRYMLLSDALIERLTGDQVEAVMAHEVAHVRRRHLVWLAVCMVSSVMVLAWGVQGLAWGAQGLASQLDVSTLNRYPDAMSVAIGVAGLVGAGLVFGAVSRRFEWQADAFAVQHLSRTRGGEASTASVDAVVVMSSALQAVADLNGMDPGRFTWRHGSIRERQRRLATLADQPLDALPIDRQVRWIKVAAAVGLGASLVPIAFATWGGTTP